MSTIVAQATAPGRGSVGIIRVSGPLVPTIAQAILKQLPKPRVASLLDFYNHEGQILDQGLALYFPNPNSFTGEEVLELQGHGGPVIIDLLLKECLKLGARMAKPGEFSERAFLNDKMDLAQAEAVADLINASSEQAVKSAIRSLQGEFSKKIYALVEALIHLRIYVEAAIDFPEEEIDFLADTHISDKLQLLHTQLQGIQRQAKQGSMLREGINVVIAGRPNAGKSSLLNALAGKEAAIVTEIPGTTRDLLREAIHIAGVPLHIIDTAGLRQTDDIVEKEGIRRAREAINQADHILLMLDVAQESELPDLIKEHLQDLPKVPCTVIYNKIDLLGLKPNFKQDKPFASIYLSAKLGQGIELLQDHLLRSIGFDATAEGTFMARARHVDAIERAFAYVEKGQKQLIEHKAGELLAEDLRQAQMALSEITGEFHSDDLLGKIFSSFCIGK
ncbi:MAG: tRNA uridine-5-carboxymethylaminomethyl(34) synthesis GTPase MnmE [Gammaproteobacteria bacterium]|nr:tRNA uridine-5-carboxymethylaminomethyl(34) synthesis GTPase MnmE [Gammaproteobacteria bacterium]